MYKYMYMHTYARIMYKFNVLTGNFHLPAQVDALSHLFAGFLCTADACHLRRGSLLGVSRGRLRQRRWLTLWRPLQRFQLHGALWARGGGTMRRSSGDLEPRPRPAAGGGLRGQRHEHVRHCGVGLGFFAKGPAVGGGLQWLGMLGVGGISIRIGPRQLFLFPWPDL